MTKTKSSKDKRIARWWDTVSHHPLYAALIAALVAAAVVAHAGGVFESSPSASPATSHALTSSRRDVRPLRAVFQPTAPELYAVAFNRDIGLPKSPEQWEGLHARGGIDVRESDFRLTLADPSEDPLTITNIEAVVYGSSRPPTASVALVYTQGAAGLEEFGAVLESEAVGTTAPFHRAEHGVYTSDPSTTPVFFESHHIALVPNEIYEAKVAVVDSVNRELEYGFVLTGNTASGAFTYRTSRFRIAGYPRTEPGFAHEYWTLRTTSGQPCWVPPDRSGQQPRCP